jgi:uncharacterized protein YndB with AHSA1/START domain
MDEAHSAGAAAGDDAFVISRVFNAPAEKVFAAWTDPVHLLAWFGPRGFTLTAKLVDIRSHGSFHYAMRTPVGQTVWGHWTFREVAAPARMAFVATFSDEAGGLTRNPWTPGWPAHVLTTVTFTEHDGRTTLTMHAIPIDANDLEHATFLAGHRPMHMGWTATLNQLADHLTKA